MSNEEGCCGSVMTRMDVVQSVSRMLADGHVQLAELYRSIAKEVESETDKNSFNIAADVQEALAKTSLQVTILIENPATMPNTIPPPADSDRYVGTEDLK